MLGYQLFFLASKVPLHFRLHSKGGWYRGWITRFWSGHQGLFGTLLEMIYHVMFSVRVTSSYIECERPCSCSGDSGWCFGLFESSRNFPSQSSNIWQECTSSARVDDNCLLVMTRKMPQPNCLSRLVWQSPLPHSQHASVHHLWCGTRPNTQNCWQKRCSAFSMWEMWESLGVIAGWAQDVMMSWCEGWGCWDRRFWSQFLLGDLILIILQMVENTVICYCPSFLRTPQQTKPKIKIALCIYCHSFKQLVDTCPGLPTSNLVARMYGFGWFAVAFAIIWQTW